MTPMALWGLSGVVERMTQRRRPFRVSEDQQLANDQIRALRTKIAAAGTAQKWQQVVDIVSESYGEDCPPLFVRFRAEAYWRLGKRQTAAQEWASTLDPQEETTRATLLALSGDREGYAKYCKALLMRPEADAAGANNRAWAMVLLPKALEDYTPVIAMAQRGVEAATTPDERAMYLNTLGAVYLRAGDAKKACEALLQSEKIRSLNINWPLLVLGYRQLGKKAEAKHWEQNLENHVRGSFGTPDRSRQELLLFELELKALEKTPS